MALNVLAFEVNKSLVQSAVLVAELLDYCCLFSLSLL
jgi:hypothetical protein